MGTRGTTVSCFCVGISITKPAPRRLRAMNPAETGDASIRAGYASTFDDEKLTRNRGNNGTSSNTDTPFAGLGGSAPRALSSVVKELCGFPNRPVVSVRRRVILGRLW